MILVQTKNAKVVIDRSEIFQSRLPLIDLLDHKDAGTGTERLLDEVLSMAACKAAIKAGHRLSDSEILELLADGDKAESSFRCPHGRPTTIRFTLAELEKQFHRT